MRTIGIETGVTSPELQLVDVGDVALAVHRWRPASPVDDAPVLLAHATGFHARCWDQVVALLGQRHVLAVDLRGHGRSGKEPPARGWRTFGEDLARLVATLDLKDVLAVGHSMGGHAMVTAAALEGDRFARLTLIDPVILSPAEYAEGGVRGVPEGFEHPTARRRDRWASPEEMIARFRERIPYSAFAPAVLDDYCRHGLLPAPDGNGFVLACRPSFEARVYMSARDAGSIYDRVAEVAVPVLVVRAMEPAPDRGPMDFSYSPTWPGLAARFRRGREVHLAARTHFFPMEEPALAARFILEDEPPGRG
jgi:lipase